MAQDCKANYIDIVVWLDIRPKLALDRQDSSGSSFYVGIC